MELIILLILTIILSPVVFAIGLAWPLFLFGFVSLLLDKHRQFPPASCDIDPKNHPAFIWSPEGRGIVGGVDTGLRQY